MDLTVNQELEEQTYSFKTAGTYVEDDINLTVAMALADTGGVSSKLFVKSAAYPKSAALASGTTMTAMTNVISFSAGTWLLIASVRFGDMNGHNCAAIWYSGADEASLSGESHSRTTNYGDGAQAVLTVATVQYDTPFVARVYGYQASGTTQNDITTYWKAVKLGGIAYSEEDSSGSESGSGNALDLPVGSIVVLGNTCYTEGTGTSTTISTGSSYATLKDPSQFGYAGTWRLMYKIMTAKVINTGLMTMNTTNVSAIGTQHCYVSGKTITIHGSFTNKTAHSDTTRALLTISPSVIGVSSICGSTFIINGVDDGNNGIPVLQLQSNGTLSEIDYISRATSIPTAQNGVTTFSFTTAVTDNYIYDSACCEFHWQRTA